MDWLAQYWPYLLAVLLLAVVAARLAIMLPRFRQPTRHSGERTIRVVGVGGAGGNAVNHMIKAKHPGVEYIAVNTDAQVLDESRATRRVQIGQQLTKGLGAGGDAVIGREAAEEDVDELAKMVAGADLVFIAAGLGGGTGSGAAPVIAAQAREAGALTVGVVTKPFSFEGTGRRRVADIAEAELKATVDTLLLIENERVLNVVGDDTSMIDAFTVVNEVLARTVRAIVDVMTVPGLINLDFADVRTVMHDGGTATTGIGWASGPDRAVEAAHGAVTNPLLDHDIAGAGAILLNVAGASSMTMREVTRAADEIRAVADPEATIIFGTIFDDRLGDELRVTVIATKFRERTAESPVAEEASEVPAEPMDAIEAPLAAAAVIAPESAAAAAAVEPPVESAPSAELLPVAIASAMAVSAATETPSSEEPDEQAAAIADHEEAMVAPDAALAAASMATFADHEETAETPDAALPVAALAAVADHEEPTETPDEVLPAASMAAVADHVETAETPDAALPVAALAALAYHEEREATPEVASFEESTAPAAYGETDATPEDALPEAALAAVAYQEETTATPVHEGLDERTVPVASVEQAAEFDVDEDEEVAPGFASFEEQAASLAYDEETDAVAGFVSAEEPVASEYVSAEEPTAAIGYVEESDATASYATAEEPVTPEYGSAEEPTAATEYVEEEAPVVAAAEMEFEPEEPAAYQATGDETVLSGEAGETTEPATPEEHAPLAAPVGFHVAAEEPMEPAWWLPTRARTNGETSGSSSPAPETTASAVATAIADEEEPSPVAAYEAPTAIEEEPEPVAAYEAPAEIEESEPVTSLPPSLASILADEPVASAEPPAEGLDAASQAGEQPAAPAPGTITPRPAPTTPRAEPVRQPTSALVGRFWSRVGKTRR